MPRYGCPPEDRQELFRRMAFNCLVRNTDDHELNHGLLHVKHDTFELAPAYDIVPSLQRHAVHRHALLIGETGAGTLSNLISNAEAFAMNRDEALACVLAMQRTVLETWQETFYAAGFDDQGLRAVEHVFKPLPQED